MKLIKNYFLAAVLVALTHAAFAQNLPSNVSPNGLIGYWPLDGNANDLSGNGHNGSAVGIAAGTNRNGTANSCLDFNGTSNGISLGNIFNPSTQTAITISGWFCPKPMSSGYDLWSGVDIGVKPENHITLRVTSASIQKFQAMHGKPSAPNAHYESVFANNTYSNNVWYHLVGIYKNGLARLFVNGVEQTAYSSTGNNLSTIPSSSGVFIGRSIQDSYVNYFFRGKLDDIGIWNRELSTCEINALFNGTGLSNAAVQIPSIINANTGTNLTINAQGVVSGASMAWETNPLNTGWKKLNDNATYQGTSTANLTINNLSVSNHNQVFRAFVVGNVCIDTSNIGMINIADTCVYSVRDTNIVTIYDTNFVSVFDTVHVVVNDTNIVTQYDTIYVTITDTLFVTIGHCGNHGHGHGNCGHGNCGHGNCGHGNGGYGNGGHGNGGYGNGGHGNGGGKGHGDGSISYPHGMTIYPNPSSDYVNVNIANEANDEEELMTIQIENENGSIILEKIVTGGSVSIPLSKYADKGFYTVRLLDSSKNVIDIKKVIMQ